MSAADDSDPDEFYDAVEDDDDTKGDLETADLVAEEGIDKPRGWNGLPLLAMGTWTNGRTKPL